MGTCQVCGRYGRTCGALLVSRGAVMRPHGPRRIRCPGSGVAPVEGPRGPFLTRLLWWSASEEVATAAARVRELADRGDLESQPFNPSHPLTVLQRAVETRDRLARILWRGGERVPVQYGLPLDAREARK